MKAIKNIYKKIFYIGKDNLNKIIYKETTKKNIIIFMGAGSISNMAINFMKTDE